MVHIAEVVNPPASFPSQHSNLKIFFLKEKIKKVIIYFIKLKLGEYEVELKL